MRGIFISLLVFFYLVLFGYSDLIFSKPDKVEVCKILSKHYRPRPNCGNLEPNRFIGMQSIEERFSENRCYLLVVERPSEEILILNINSKQYLNLQVNKKVFVFQNRGYFSGLIYNYSLQKYNLK